MPALTYVLPAACETASPGLGTAELGGRAPSSAAAAAHPAPIIGQIGKEVGGELLNRRIAPTRATPTRAGRSRHIAQRREVLIGYLDGDGGHGGVLQMVAVRGGVPTASSKGKGAASREGRDHG